MHTHFTSTFYLGKSLKSGANEKNTNIIIFTIFLVIYFIGILTAFLLNFQITIQEAISLIIHKVNGFLLLFAFFLSLPLIIFCSVCFDIFTKQKRKHYDYILVIIGVILLYIASLGVGYLIIFLLGWPPLLHALIVGGVIAIFALIAKIGDWIDKSISNRRTIPKAPTNLCLEHLTGVITLTTYTVLGRHNFFEHPEEALARLEEQHAAVYFRDGEWWVEDLGSRYGTYLNGVRVKKERLKEGDVVNLGAVVDVVVKPCEKTLAQSAAPHTAERRRAVVKLEETEGKTKGHHHSPEETRLTTLPGREAPDSTPTNIRNVVKLEEVETTDRT